MRSSWSSAKKKQWSPPSTVMSSCSHAGLGQRVGQEFALGQRDQAVAVAMDQQERRRVGGDVAERARGIQQGRIVRVAHQHGAGFQRSRRPAPPRARGRS